MKAFVTLALVCLIATTFSSNVELTEEQKTKLMAHFQKCIEEEKVSPEEANRLRNKDFANPTQHMKCFGTCLFEKIGVLKDGVIQENTVIEKLGAQIPEDELKASVAKCKDIKGIDRCDTGYQIFECFEKSELQIKM